MHLAKPVTASVLAQARHYVTTHRYRALLITVISFILLLVIYHQQALGFELKIGDHTRPHKTPAHSIPRKIRQALPSKSGDRVEIEPERP